MPLEPGLAGLALAVLIVTLATAVQATVGFGLALISAPLLLLIDPAFVPGPMIAAALVLALWMTWTERHALTLGHLKPAIYGRLLGTPAAAALMGALSPAGFDLVFGLLVLAAVGMSLLHPHVQPTAANLFVASIASGFMSTLSSIGGPPMALVYQNAQGAELRANLAGLFIIGCSISLLALVLIGEFGLRELVLAVWLCLGIGLGTAICGPLRRWLDQRSARPFLLALCAASALLVLGRALVRINA